jgi:nitroreductase
VDTFLTIASKRDLRSYRSAPVPSETLQRVLAAGQVCGNAMNRQQRRFVVLSDATRERAAAMVTRPSNLQRATAAVAIVSQGDGQWASFDAGRIAQNMMLAAWNDGVGSCPNAIARREELSALLGLGEGEDVAILLSFGFPPGRRDPSSRSAEEWLRRADRAPLTEVTSEA